MRHVVSFAATFVAAILFVLLLIALDGVIS